MIYSSISFQKIISLANVSQVMKSARSILIMIHPASRLCSLLSRQRCETLTLWRMSIAKFPTLAKKTVLPKILKGVDGHACGAFAKVSAPRKPHWTDRYSWRKSIRPAAYQSIAAVAVRWHPRARRNSPRDLWGIGNKSTMTCRERRRIGFRRILATHLSSQKIWKPLRSL